MDRMKRITLCCALGAALGFSVAPLYAQTFTQPRAGNYGTTRPATENSTQMRFVANDGVDAELALAMESEKQKAIAQKAKRVSNAPALIPKEGAQHPVAAGPAAARPQVPKQSATRPQPAGPAPLGGAIQNDEATFRPVAASTTTPIDPNDELAPLPSAEETDAALSDAQFNDELRDAAATELDAPRHDSYQPMTAVFTDPTKRADGVEETSDATLELDGFEDAPGVIGPEAPTASATLTGPAPAIVGGLEDGVVEEEEVVLLEEGAETAIPLTSAQPVVEDEPSVDLGAPLPLAEQSSDDALTSAPSPSASEPTPIPESKPQRHVRKETPAPQYPSPMYLPKEKKANNGGLIAPIPGGAYLPPTMPMMFPNLAIYGCRGGVPVGLNAPTTQLVLPNDPRAGMVVQSVPSCAAPSCGGVPSCGYVDANMLQNTNCNAPVRPKVGVYTDSAERAAAAANCSAPCCYGPTAPSFGVDAPPPMGMRQNVAAWGATSLGEQETLVSISEIGEDGTTIVTYEANSVYGFDGCVDMGEPKAVYSGLIADVEYLGWQTERSDSVYATIGSASQDSATDKRALSPTGSGLRAKLGVRSLNGWDLVAGYTYYGADRTRSVDSTSVGEGYALRDPRGVLSADGAESVTGRATANLNVYDIEVGRWNTSCRGGWRPFLGFRWTHLKETLGSNASYAAGASANYAESTLNAYALRLGAEWNRDLVGNLQVFARGAGTIGVGEISATAVGTYDGGYYATSASKTYATPSVEAALGVALNFNNFQVKGGYEFNDWFNASKLNGGVDDFIAHGWFVGASWNR